MFSLISSRNTISVLTMPLVNHTLVPQNSSQDRDIIYARCSRPFLNDTLSQLDGKLAAQLFSAHNIFEQFICQVNDLMFTKRQTSHVQSFH